MFNYLSRYRDRHIYNIEPSTRSEVRHSKLWYYGSSGPFGRVFESTEIDFYSQYVSLFPLFIYPQLKSIKNSFLLQEDSFYCGVFVIINIMDLVYSQWDKLWEFDEDWQKIVSKHQPILVDNE